LKKKRRTRNTFEKKLERQLKRAKIFFDYESEKIPYVLARHYIPDFILHTPKGKIYVEAKGHFDRDAKAKMAAVKRQHPNLDIRLVFYRKDKRNIKWAERHGYLFSFEKIPEDWLI
jgi:predicted nuclease of restriction endonuclease-like RecB superfamily